MKNIASPVITFGVLSSKYWVFEVSSKKICILLAIIYKFGCRLPISIHEVQINSSVKGPMLIGLGFM
jgi:hypothetical protein